MSDAMKLSELPPELWQRVSNLFDVVIELDEKDRIPFIRTIWAEDPQVARELIALLVAAVKTEKTGKIAQDPFNSVLNKALAEPAVGYVQGRKFGAWTLDVRLGQGGMGEVWRARRSDGLYKADVAIKLLRTDLSQDTLSRRFARERTVLARLNHPNIARLLDAGVEDGQAFIVLELVDGIPLLDYVKARAPELDQRLRLVRDITLAVEHAHNQHVLHRDLKPNNVLVTKDGQVKLLDFGIAGVLDNDPEEPMTKLTQLTGRGLTLEYASPEQVTGDPTMPASDVYSLGVVLFHLCTGNRPFAGSSTRAALEYAVANSDPPLASESLLGNTTTRQIVDQIPPPVDATRLRGDLDNIIRRAIRLNASERYPTAAALAADIEAWMSARPISLRASDRMYAARLWMKRHWRLIGLVSLGLALLLVSIGWSIRQRQIALTELEAAQEQSVRQTKVIEALGETLRRARASASSAADPNVNNSIDSAIRDAEAKLANDPLARERLRKEIDGR
jgi:eukaryotic-like serine/threonine-protein kinase